MLSLSRNGLRAINEQYTTDQMVTFGHNFISLYLDHDESLRAIDWDDVVQFPAVISPVKPSATCNHEQSASEAEDAVAEEPVPIQVVYASEAGNAVDQDCVASRTRMSKRKANWTMHKKTKKMLLAMKKIQTLILKELLILTLR
jgi:hypothetical protein